MKKIIKKGFKTQTLNPFPEDKAGGRTYFWANMPEFIFVIIFLLVALWGILR